MCVYIHTKHMHTCIEFLLYSCWLLIQFSQLSRYLLLHSCSVLVGILFASYGFVSICQPLHVMFVLASRS